MSFTLRITFSGLCLFVPEATDTGGAGRMHVLLPGMSGHHHSPEDRHVAALSYDAGYLVEGGPLLGVTALGGLTGYTLEFGSGEAASLALCSQIADLREVTGRGVDPDLLDADTGQKLVARVTLGAGAITRVAPGMCWEWHPGEFRPMACKVEWEILDFSGDSLTVTAQPLGGGGAAKELGTLYPVEGRVNLEVLHETPQDLPPDPLPLEHQPMLERGENAKHFSAYFGLFGEPVPIVLPRFWGPLDDCPPITGGCAEIPPDMGSTPWACLVGGVGVGGG
jgi:hypothetical protein